MTLFWGSSYGFPTPLPTGRFKDYIKRNEIEASHFYCAYPEATTTIVALGARARREAARVPRAHARHGARGLRARLARRS